MQFIKLFLVFIAPFHPKWAFNQLSDSERKSSLTIISLLFVSIATIILQQTTINKPSIQISFIYTSGLICGILITGVVIAILINRVFFVALSLKNGISIASTSAAFLLVSPVLHQYFQTAPAIADMIQEVCYASLVSIGISYFYKKTIKKSLLIGFGIFIIKTLIIVSFFGVQV